MTLQFTLIETTNDKPRRSTHQSYQRRERRLQNISFALSTTTILDIQVTLREEIKSACEYRPFEKCDNSTRLSSEISCKKMEHVIKQLDGMKEIVD